jgi:hypothetical protein
MHVRKKKMKGVFQMKRKITLLVGLGLLTAAVAFSQTPNPGQAPNGAPQAQAPAPGQGAPRGGAPAAAEKTFEGRLTKVDAATKTITVAAISPKDGDPKDMSFKYGDATVVVGGDKTVQGLASKTGSTLKVTYSGDMASRIEISDAK